MGLDAFRSMQSSFILGLLMCSDHGQPPQDMRKERDPASRSEMDIRSSSQLQSSPGIRNPDFYIRCSQYLPHSRNGHWLDIPRSSRAADLDGKVGSYVVEGNFTRIPPIGAAVTYNLQMGKAYYGMSRWSSRQEQFRAIPGIHRNMFQEI